MRTLQGYCKIDSMPIWDGRCEAGHPSSADRPMVGGDCATPGCRFMGYGDDNLCDVCYQQLQARPTGSQAETPSPKPKRGSGTYGKFPLEILADQGMRKGHLRVFGGLACFANPARKAWPRQQTLADALGMKRTTVARLLGDLERAGYIWKTSSPEGKGGRSTIWVVPDGTTVPVPAGARMNPAADPRKRPLDSVGVRRLATLHAEEAVRRGDTSDVDNLDTPAAHDAARTAALTEKESDLRTLVGTTASSAPNNAPPPPEIQEAFQKIKAKTKPRRSEEEGLNPVEELIALSVPDHVEEDASV